MTRHNLAKQPTEVIAAHIAEKWAGRCLTTGDLKTIYNIHPRQGAQVFLRLTAMGAIADKRCSGGREQITSWRIKERA